MNLTLIQTLTCSRGQLIFQGCHVSLAGGRQGEEADFVVTEFIELISPQRDNHITASDSIETVGIPGIRTDMEPIPQEFDTVSSSGDQIVPALDGRVALLEERVSRLETLLRSVQTTTLTDFRSDMVSRRELDAQLEALSQAHSEDIHLLKCQLDAVMKEPRSPFSPQALVSPSPQPDRKLTRFSPTKTSRSSSFQKLTALPLAEMLVEASKNEDDDNEASPKQASGTPDKSRRGSRPPGSRRKKAKKPLFKPYTALPRSKALGLLGKKTRIQKKRSPTQEALPLAAALQPSPSPPQLAVAATTTWEVVVQAYPWVFTTFGSIPDHPTIKWLAALPAVEGALEHGPLVQDGSKNGFLLSNRQQRRFDNLKAALVQSAGIAAK